MKNYNKMNCQKITFSKMKITGAVAMECKCSVTQWKIDRMSGSREAHLINFPFTGELPMKPQKPHLHSIEKTANLMQK